MIQTRQVKSTIKRIYAISASLNNQADCLVDAETVNREDLANLREWEEALKSVRQEIEEELKGYTPYVNNGERVVYGDEEFEDIDELLARMVL